MDCSFAAKCRLSTAPYPTAPTPNGFNSPLAPPELTGRNGTQLAESRVVLFNTPLFFWFFTSFFVLYSFVFLRHRPRLGLILVSSLVFYAGWIARRWEDPCFPDAFPHFGTEDYWETETRDLEQQVERILTGSGGGVDQEWVAAAEAVDSEPTELENKDFFWDL